MRRGNPNPPKKTRYSNPVVVFDLETEKWHNFRSVSLDARTLEMANNTLLEAMRQMKPAKQRWLIAYKGEEDKLAQSLHYHQKHYNSQVRHISVTRQNKKKVPLRIDSHTVIYVSPEDATEEYAKQYRQRLADNKANFSNERR